MRRVVVGIVGLMLCSTAQAESWTGKLYRQDSEGYAHPWQQLELKNFKGRGWRCNRGRGVKLCTTSKTISSRCARGSAVGLAYRGISAAVVTYVCDGEKVGTTYYQGRLRYSRR